MVSLRGPPPTKSLLHKLLPQPFQFKRSPLLPALVNTAWKVKYACNSGGCKKGGKTCGWV